MKQITDKDLIVFLVANGLEIKQIRRDLIRNRSIVYFENSPALDDSILKFANKSADINIGDLLAAAKRVTTLLQLQKN